MKHFLIDDARRAWRWFSVQAMAMTAAIQAVWTAMPDDMKQRLPGRAVALLSVTLLLLGIGGRLLRQERRTS